MWSPNEISKQEKQRDIFAYITLPFFQVKKGSLSTFRFRSGAFVSLEAPTGIGPVNEGFADLCLTAWLRRRFHIPQYMKKET